ncbi:hypothetical protein RFI_38795 [Reticulomyxa filosa]|uniref:EF-hand domain-containing protein n=1 Tax=Reticulomyxa filosa TaxID=46433 RepID=X6LAY2_RETFI|nr:hypothetical protein RFI_38795 [Reticulomyxa filosa]|eukprot:ETN98698.1 hypothetical protein RFI_38795 [Reticulomyxa filosa]
MEEKKKTVVNIDTGKTETTSEKKKKFHNLSKEHKNRWLTVHGKKIKNEIPEDKKQYYKTIFDAIDQNNDGELQICELLSAFEFAELQLHPVQLFNDLKQVFAQWLHYRQNAETETKMSVLDDEMPNDKTKSQKFVERKYKTVNNMDLEKLILVMPAYHRQLKIRAIDQEQKERDRMDAFIFSNQCTKNN